MNDEVRGPLTEYVEQRKIDTMKSRTFTFRDLIWATVVVAIFGGWWVDHAEQVRRQIQLVDHSNNQLVDVFKKYHEMVEEVIRLERELGSK
jgi:hypothetical protein